MLNDYRIIIAPEVAADLEVIHAYIAQDSPDHAAETVERILKEIDGLKEVPVRQLYEIAAGRIKHPVRMLPVSPFIIFYRLIETERVARVLTVRHGARRRPKFR